MWPPAAEGPSSDAVVHAWPAEIMLKVTGRAMPGALTLSSFTVFAAAGDGDKAEAASAPVTANVDQLSLYTVPEQKSRFVEAEAGQLEHTVAALRRFVEPCASWCQNTYDRIRPKVQGAVQFGSDTYAYLKNPPADFYPRAGVIGFTGVLGLFLARGSRIKKLVYPAGLMTVSASLYYPEQAAAIARSAGDSVYERTVQGYAAVEKLIKPQQDTKKSTDSETKA